MSAAYWAQAFGEGDKAPDCRSSDLVVAYLTGNGFKTPEAVDVSGATRVRIPARLSAFEDALPARERSLVEVG